MTRIIHKVILEPNNEYYYHAGEENTTYLT